MWIQITSYNWKTWELDQNRHRNRAIRLSNKVLSACLLQALALLCLYPLTSIPPYLINPRNNKSKQSQIKVKSSSKCNWSASRECNFKTGLFPPYTWLIVFILQIKALICEYDKSACKWMLPSYQSNNYFFLVSFVVNSWQHC